MILTPDQRLRVFISSTLQELGDERAAARAAIEALRLTPVMFETGARAHPPRALYRSYIEQSDIFIGIYWERYGWIAPDMEISGLEDELELSHRIPRLMYIKKGNPEDRLKKMLDRIANAGISYKRFDSADELRDLIEDDLMVMISERFHAETSMVVEESPPIPHLPVQLSTFVGREREIEDLSAQLSDDGIRLMTLIGPGGIGKTRLAVETARSLEDEWADGVYFVTLANLRDPRLVSDAIARSVGLHPPAEIDPLDALREFLSERHCLLIVDNFEHLLESAPVMSELLDAAPRLKILVTSRAPLRVRGEHMYDLPPLDVPTDVDEVTRSDAVRLFLDRALAVRPDLKVDPTELAMVAEICRRVDGLPLAIELAAAQVRILPPGVLLERLGARLSDLAGGTRDMPERHQRLHDTIEWSYQLLDPDAQKLFSCLAAFRGGFTLEAVETVCGADLDIITTLSTLLDHSLVRSESRTQGEPRFMMLQTIREFARECLSDSPEDERIRDLHADFYSEMAIEGGTSVGSALQQEVLDRLDTEIDNLRGAITWMLQRGKADRVAQALFYTWPFWWSRAHLEEGRQWGARTLEHELTPLGRARALTFEAGMAFWQSDYPAALPAFFEASEIFARENDLDGLALTDMALGLVEGFLGDYEKGLARVRRAVDRYKEMNDRWGLVSALTSLGWLQSETDRWDEHDDQLRYALDVATEVGSPADMAMAELNLARFLVQAGRPHEGLPLMANALDRLFALRHIGASTNVIDAVAFTAAGQGRWGEAVTLAAAADSVRRTISFENPQLHVARVAQLRLDAEDHLGADVTREKWEAGEKLGYDDAVGMADEVLDALSRELARA